MVDEKMRGRQPATHGTIRKRKGMDLTELTVKEEGGRGELRAGFVGKEEFRLETLPKERGKVSCT